uniref:Peptidase M14 domain-containing protein n=1 Tax=Phaeomonas parva TaxID=124430 RepID=A0A7S1XVN0_9STRA|mmetsp:Transcript_41369/g.129536  ORF Transcript_41369/g.129536 Transcript_41369/m.129536 type:complete len:678 (+) Transcript_41369:68-2101(+)
MRRKRAGMARRAGAALAALLLGLAAGAAHAKARHFKNLSYPEIRERLRTLAAKYPQYATLTTAQERYGVGTAGECGDGPCEQFILRLSGVSEEDQPPEMPEGFVSGEVHGNERVGPVAALEASELLVYTAACVDTGAHEDCNKIVEYGLTARERAWLHRTIHTRALYVMPMTNALGYYLNTREENGVDPNRDFPYDYPEGHRCMRSITARSLNEIFRDHIFQLSLTFHSGTESIGYEWGSNNHGSGHDTSPDDVAQAQLAAGESDFAGGFSHTFKYKYGRMSSNPYPVDGGFEDWAYAASWDTEAQHKCDTRAISQCTGCGDYDPARTTGCEDATMRAFNFLVETSKEYSPGDADLGTTTNLLRPAGNGGDNGHVARNIRLLFMHMDVLAPNIDVVVPEEESGEDAAGISMRELTQKGDCVAFLGESKPENTQEISLEWTMWGSFNVDDFEILATPWPSNDDGSLSCIGSARKAEEILGVHSTSVHTVQQDGAATARWQAGVDTYSNTVTFGVKELEPALAESGVAMVTIRSTIDGAWGASNAGAQPVHEPQSHVVNARTNPDWDFATADGKHRVVGRKWFYSAPVLVRSSASSGAADVVLNVCADGKHDESALSVIINDAATVRFSERRRTLASHAIHHESHRSHIAKHSRSPPWRTLQTWAATLATSSRTAALET